MFESNFETLVLDGNEHQFCWSQKNIEILLTVETEDNYKRYTIIISFMLGIPSVPKLSTFDEAIVWCVSCTINMESKYLKN